MTNSMKNQQHQIININGESFPTFAYKDYGIKGVGKYRRPIINMDKYIDHTLDVELHEECCIGLALSDEYKMGMIYGSLPPGVGTSWTEMLSEIEKYDPSGVHINAIEKLMAQCPKEQRYAAVYKYAYFAMGAAIPWFFAFYLMRGDFSTKAIKQGTLTPAAARFPKLIEYINTLPFKTIGRILFFTTYPNAGVICHRDANVCEHKDHNINLFFTGSRPSYVMDPEHNKKIYLDQTAKSYFFNNRDYHGVDPESSFRYTLRIDGTFTNELQEELGLEDGYTWKWSYEE